MSKFLLPFIVVVCALFLGYVAVSAMPDKDCDAAVRLIQEKVQTFTQAEGEVGKCDGLCIDWSPVGCTISDDVNSWFVGPWGNIKGPVEEPPVEEPVAEVPAPWQTVTVADVVSFQIPLECRMDAAAGSRYVICPTVDHPSPIPEMVISSDGEMVNVRRWEGLEWEHWDAVVASMQLITPLTHPVSITIEK